MAKRRTALLAMLLALTLTLTAAQADVLRSGDKGDAVRALQTALAAQGYLAESAVGGSFTKKTADALKAFQTAQGWAATGVADPRTQATLLGADGLGDAAGALLTPQLAETGDVNCLGYWGLVAAEGGGYAFNSVIDQAVIDLYGWSKYKLSAASILLHYDNQLIRIFVTVPKGTSAKKAQTICEAAASLVGDTAATYAGRGYEPSDPKGKRNNHFGTLYDDYNLNLTAYSIKGDVLCYGVKSMGNFLHWRPAQ